MEAVRQSSPKKALRPALRSTARNSEVSASPILGGLHHGYRLARHAAGPDRNVLAHEFAEHSGREIEHLASRRIRPACVDGRLAHGRGDGVGFDAAAVRIGSPSNGLGLRLIQDRLAAVGGTLQILSSRGQGTELRTVIPEER